MQPGEYDRAVYRAVAVAVAVVLAAGAVVILAGQSGARRSAQPPAAPVPAGSCPSAAVRRGGVPVAAREAGIPSWAPWVADRRTAVTGTLFYYGQPALRRSRSAVIGVHGSAGHGISAKILWWVDGSGSRTLQIAGRRLDAPGSFHQSVQGPSLGRNTTFPSIVDVPAAGCWSFDVRSGSTTGSITFRAVPMTA